MKDNVNLTPEMLEQAAKTESAAALQALAQENGIDLTAEQAAVYYAQLHPETGTLSDEELDNVSGGCGERPDHCSVCGSTDLYEGFSPPFDSYWYCPSCGTRN